MLIMKRERLTVRTINKRTDSLPEDALDRWLLLLKRDNKTGECLDRKVFFAHRAHVVTIYAFTHYIILPNFLRP